MFHLAIPARDLKEAEGFYRSLGTHIGRKYKTHIVMDFHGAQVVLHQSGLWDLHPKIYPRHFGVILSTKQKLDDLWNRWQFAEFIFEEYFIRREGEREEHHTFFLKDPSNNLIEFKWYKNRSAILG